MEIKVEEEVKKVLNKNFFVQEVAYKATNDIAQRRMMNAVQDFAENMYDTDAKKVLAVATTKLLDKMENLV